MAGDALSFRTVSACLYLSAIDRRSPLTPFIDPLFHSYNEKAPQITTPFFSQLLITESNYSGLQTSAKCKVGRAKTVIFFAQSFPFLCDYKYQYTFFLRQQKVP